MFAATSGRGLARGEVVGQQYGVCSIGYCCGRAGTQVLVVSTAQWFCAVAIPLTYGAVAHTHNAGVLKF